MSESLKDKTAKGLFWGALNSGSTQVLNLVIGVFLARLLTPSDYGIIGVLTLFTAIAGDLQSAGFTQGLINIKNEDVRNYNAVFSFNVFMSVILYIILFLSAPYIAVFFHQDCLTSVSRVVFLTFLISSLGIAHSGYMHKNMMNKEMAIIGVVALVVSGSVGILLALSHYSYWALAWQQIAYMIVVNCGRYYCVKTWVPKFTCDFEPIKQMAPFAMKILFTKIINTLSSNILTVLFGRLFPIHLVGNYSQAYKWNNMAHSLISNTVGQVAQTVMVQSDEGFGEGDNRPLRVYRKMSRFTCFWALPIMFGFALISKEFIIITIGEKWLECVPILQVLCVSGAFMPLFTMYQNLAMSKGRSDIYMWLNIGQILTQLCVIFLFHTFGIFTMVCVYSVCVILWLLPWHHFVGRLIKYSWKMVVHDIVPFCIAALLVMTLTYIVTASVESSVLRLLLRIVVAFILYYIIMKVAKVDILCECEKFIIKKI